jgi:hypothetical protein
MLGTLMDHNQKILNCDIFTEDTQNCMCDCGECKFYMQGLVAT